MVTTASSGRRGLCPPLRVPGTAGTSRDIAATYDNGILEITVPVVPQGRKQEVSIKVTKG